MKATESNSEEEEFMDKPNEEDSIKTDLSNPQGLDLFILFNEKEDEVEGVVNFLEISGLATHFWRRSIAIGQEWEKFEHERLRKAKLILVFLGRNGWGPNHERIAIEARNLGKRMFPVLLPGSSQTDLNKGGGIFKDLRYFLLADLTTDSLSNLGSQIQNVLSGKSQEPIFDNIDLEDFSWISILLTGNNRKKQKAVQRLSGLSKEEKEKASKWVLDLLDGDTKTIQVNVSWIAMALLIVVPEYDRAKNFVLLSFANTDRRRKFWILANAWNLPNKASYLSELLNLAQKDSNRLINSLADALNLKEGFFDKISESKEFEGERVNDLLRILSVTWGQRYRDQMNRFFFQEEVDFWWLITACLHQKLDARFYDRISLEPGLSNLVTASLKAIQESEGRALDEFAEFLSRFEKERLVEALKNNQFSNQNFPHWDRLEKKIENNFQRRQREYQTQIQNDTANAENDLLDVLPEVKILSAVMISRDLKPPLAIGLFGNWGTGKSYFIHLMRDEINRLKDSGKPVYCSSVVQIEFNAWHYVEANLWASLMSTILEKLIGVVEPEVTAGEKKTSLLKELDDSKKEKADAESEKQKLQEQYEDERKALLLLEQKRLTNSLKLKEFSLLDIPKLLEKDQLKAFKDTFEELGINHVYRSVEDFEAKLNEVKSFSGRFWTLVQGIAKSKNWGWILLFLFLGLVLIPWGWGALKAWDLWPLFAKSISTLTVQISTTLASIGGMLVHLVSRYSKHLSTLEKANFQIQEEFQRKRANPGEDEKALAEAVIRTESQILEAESKISATEDRIQVIEKKIFEIENENSLAHFLKTRTGSGDYQKHLGLVSVIRKDFETLSRILLEENTFSALKQVDRIVLYIDDLDRCPEKTVIEVLQAVHLLLAYPLFVVVVGVDSRWLMHSLKKGFGAFASYKKEMEDKSDGVDEWKTTPQNFLEKIFQIPFHLKPMGDNGFSKMMQSLMGAREQANSGPESESQVRFPGQFLVDNLPVDNPVRMGNFPDVDISNSIEGEDEEDELPEITQQALVITQWESAYASKLHVFIRTPRTAKRFSNIYRLIKASIPERELAGFEGSQDQPGEFQVPMLLLSIITGSPEFCQILIPHISEFGMTRRLIIQDFNKSVEVNGFNIEMKAWDTLVESQVFPKDDRLLNKWFPKVARFSFEIGKMELSSSS